MRVQIVGIERSTGISSKSGAPKEYRIGALHTIIPLEEQAVDDGKRIAKSKGFMGASYQVDPDVIAKIEHNALPIVADLVIQDFMRYGKRESKVMEVRPVERVKQAA